MQHRFFLPILAVVILGLGGCSQKEAEYNRPAAYWYDKMIQSIGGGNLEKADSYYSSLQSEHAGSPLLGESTMILAMAHMRQGEYLLAEHFLGEYMKRFANAKEREFAEFLKIQAKYNALPNPRRDQGLIDEVIEEGESFKRQHPSSVYYARVDTMVTRLYMAQAALNEAIASLYDRVDKPHSAAYYRAMKPQPWINWDEVEAARTPWYRSIFEGDGTSSWYDFLLPDTQSVVSRNAEGQSKE